jgi:THAP domain
MPKCCVPGCRILGLSHPRKKEVSFYRIPAIKTSDRSISLEQFIKKRNAWLKAIRVVDIENLKNPRVCSLHFHSGNMCYGIFTEHYFITNYSCTPRETI